MKNLILFVSFLMCGCLLYQEPSPRLEPAQAAVEKSFRKSVIQDKDPNPLTNETDGHRIWVWRAQEGTAVSFSFMLDPSCDCKKCKPKFD